MLHPLQPKSLKLGTALFFVVVFLSLSPVRARAQDSPAKTPQEPRAAEEGDAARAEGLCARGEEFSKRGDKGDAVDHLEEAVRLYTRIYLGGRVPAPTSGPESLARYRSETAARLRRAPECIELYSRLGGRKGASDFERAQLQALRAHALGLIETDASRAVFFSRETDARAVISYKPQPRFPRAARGTIVSVTVRVRVVLDADGKVRDALVLTEQPALFGESSVEAAKAIKFKPAEKGGRAVSQFVTLEYGFQSY